MEIPFAQPVLPTIRAYPTPQVIQASHCCALEPSPGRKILALEMVTHPGWGLGGTLVAAMDRACGAEAGNSPSPTPHHDLTWVWGRRRSLVGSQGIQGRVSTDLLPCTL